MSNRIASVAVSTATIGSPNSNWLSGRQSSALPNCRCNLPLTESTQKPFYAGQKWSPGNAHCSACRPQNLFWLSVSYVSLRSVYRGCRRLNVYPNVRRQTQLILAGASSEVDPSFSTSSVFNRRLLSLLVSALKAPSHARDRSSSQTTVASSSLVTGQMRSLTK